MAISDDPLSISTGQEWGAVGEACRVPIYVTANDLSKLYAPLVREGRMDKFYYEPTRDEVAGMLRGLFDQLTPAEVRFLSRQAFISAVTHDIP